ncbi:hypothetical protein L484_016317 [Morus notabilis]|uniref:Uncharacterized protein n=1 Tax=Morus notabilis TaxID=981085 RepID=W9S677_9ROSA|nr:hypothetical protein L484_016317 [Morus notabilis]
MQNLSQKLPFGGIANEASTLPLGPPTELDNAKPLGQFISEIVKKESYRKIKDATRVSQDLEELGVERLEKKCATGETEEANPWISTSIDLLNIEEAYFFDKYSARRNEAVRKEEGQAGEEEWSEKFMVF